MRIKKQIEMTPLIKLLIQIYLIIFFYDNLFHLKQIRVFFKQFMQMYSLFYLKKSHYNNTASTVTEWVEMYISGREVMG